MSGRRLTLGTFTPSFLIDLARRRGYLTAAGLDIFEAQVVSSPQQFASLHDGEYDAIFTNPDNVLAYRYVENNPLGEILDVRVLAGIDHGLGLALFRGPDVDPARRDVRLGVDVATSGFALIGYELLEREGFDLAQVEVVGHGATPIRTDALIEGRCDYCVVNAGHEQRALAHGCVEVARVETIGPYLGTVLASLSRDPETTLALGRLRDVVVNTAAEVLAGDLDEAVVAAVVARVGLSEAGARRHLGVIRDPERGLVSGGLVDRASLATVVALRERHLPDPALAGVLAHLEDFIDPRALRA